MPRTKFDKPKYPPVDILKAVILERKMVMKLNYDELAKAANVAPDYLRKLMTRTHTDDWKPDIRKSVCRYLRINMKTTLSLMNDDGEVRI